MERFWHIGARCKQKPFRGPFNAEVFAVAGLYEYWPGKDVAAPIESYTIITTDANEMMDKIHDRMPVILPERHYDAWLDPGNEKTDALKLLKPYPVKLTGAERRRLADMAGVHINLCWLVDALED